MTLLYENVENIETEPVFQGDWRNLLRIWYILKSRNDSTETIVALI